uniref:Uncharacterized protein n=1 Tax=Anguilla anguilla TaxID=7936 RepID=A0A0E9WRP6_ANGAN
MRKARPSAKHFVQANGVLPHRHGVIHFSIKVKCIVFIKGLKKK